MNGVNKVILVGTLGKDPELKYAANGNAIANFSVATSETWNDKSTGEKQQKTEWHNISIFGKLAEIAGQYLKKGSQVYLEGRIKTRKWQDQNGNDRYSTDIVLSGFDGVMQMLGGRNDGAQSGQQQGSNQATQQYQAPEQQNTAQNFGNNGQPLNQQQMQQNGQQRAPKNQPPQYAQNDFDDVDVPF